MNTILSQLKPQTEAERRWFDFIARHQGSPVQKALLLMLPYVRGIDHEGFVYRDRNLATEVNNFYTEAVRLWYELARDSSLDEQRRKLLYYSLLNDLYTDMQVRLSNQSLGAVVATLKILSIETRRFGYHANNGLYGLVITIAGSDRPKLNSIAESKLKWAVIKVSGVGTINDIPVDGYWVVYDWWHDSQGNRGALYIICDPIRSQTNIPVTNGTIEITDWQATSTDSSGGVNWTGAETRRRIEQVPAKYDAIRADYQKLVDAQRAIQAAGGDIQAVIKETEHIHEWQVIQSDMHGHYMIATALFNSLNSVYRSSNFADICRSESGQNGVAQQQLRALYIRFLAKEKEFKHMVRRLEDWQKRTGFEKLVHAIKTVGMAPVRAAYEILIRTNAFNIGVALYALKKKYPDKYEQFRSRWYSWGGNRTHLDELVERQASRFSKIYGGLAGLPHSSDIDPVEMSVLNTIGGLPIYMLRGTDEPTEPTGGDPNVPIDPQAAAAVGQSIQESRRTGELRLPTGVGAAVAAGATAATEGAAAPYAGIIGAAYEALAALVNSLGIKLRKDTPIEQGTVSINADNKPGGSSSGSDNTLLLLGGAALIGAMFFASKK